MIGRTLGGVYVLADLIGGGGFADVYLARDLSSNAVVAVKVLHAHFARDPEVVRRFSHEARLAERLVHPNVVRVLGAGVDQGTYYIVMEYIQGHTLAAILQRRGPLPPAEALRLMLQVLTGLEAAHAVGVVHRDIKPQNLILTHDHELKIMDFGIARNVGGGTRTQTNSMVGTPEYMAPEQVHGIGVDGRTDLYAVGIVLFEVLTGAPPFTAPTPWAVIDQQLKAAPPPLAAKRAGLPPSAGRLIIRALAKDPAARYQSAQAMRAALQALLAEVEGTTAPGQRRWRLKPVLLIAPGALAMAGVIIVLAAGQTPAAPHLATPAVPAATVASVLTPAGLAETTPPAPLATPTASRLPAATPTVPTGQALTGGLALPATQPVPPAAPPGAATPRVVSAAGGGPIATATLRGPSR